MNTKISSKAGIFLALINAVGVGVTTYFAINDTLKACDTIKNYKKDNSKSIVKEVAPMYIPTAISGALTIAAGVSSAIISKKAQLSLAAAALTASKCYDKYKYQVKEMLGKKTHFDILKNISKKDSEKFSKDTIKDNESLFWEEHIGFFKANPIKLAYALADLNHRLYSEDWNNTFKYVMLYNILKDADAVLLDTDKNSEDLTWGWSCEQLMDIQEDQGADYIDYPWIHVILTDSETKDGIKYTIVSFEEEMILDPGNHGEDFALMDKEIQEIYKNTKYNPTIKTEKGETKNE